ncbi:MAG: hypothetical protein J7496_04535 [Novosphingobium sp.]|nr:hypothetical protein [Novosphingobium sp.]
MNEPKPFASLGPTLLARKGGARPAMRAQQVQPFAGFERPAAQPVDEFDWDDAQEAPQQDNGVLAMAPVGRAPEVRKPVIRHRQEALARSVAEAPARPANDRRNAFDEGRRAAFTLRVDAERHLKLRLACTIRNLSAQQIVTEALDRLLAEIPEVASLAAQVKRA